MRSFFRTMIPIYVCKGQPWFFALYLCQWFIINKGLEIASFVCGLRCRQRCRQRSHLKLLARPDSQWSLYCRPVSLFKRFLVKNTQHFGQTKPQWFFLIMHPFPSGELCPHIETKCACLKRDFLLSRLSGGGVWGVPNPYLEVLLCFKSFQKLALQPTPACGYSHTEGPLFLWVATKMLFGNKWGGCRFGKYPKGLDCLVSRYFWSISFIYLKKA